MNFFVYSWENRKLVILADIYVDFERNEKVYRAIDTPQNRPKNDEKWDFMAKTCPYMSLHVHNIIYPYIPPLLPKLRNVSANITGILFLHVFTKQIQV